MNTSQNLSIQFVSKITGINPHTIRAWEKRYQCLTPARDLNGRRLYNDNDISKLKLLQDLINSGNNISEIAKLSIAELEVIHQKYIKESGKTNYKNKVNNIDVNNSLQGLLMALHSYRLDVISHELEKLKNNIPPRDLALSLLAPLLREIGENVTGQFFSMAQEHAISALLRFHIGQIVSEYIGQMPKLASKTFLITTPEGERHEFGILIAALLCCHYNVKFYYLGVDLPYQALAEAAKQIKPDGIILGVSKVMTEQHQSELQHYIKSLRDTLDGKVQLLVGGISNNFMKGKSENIEFIPTLQLLDMKLANL